MPDDDPPPEEPPSFHDAFAEDRGRAYKEFAATGLLVVGTMLVVAGWIAPATAEGTEIGIALGVASIVAGVLLLAAVIRASPEAAGEDG